MNITSSLEQITKTRNRGAKIVLREYKLDLISRFILYFSNNQKLTQKQIVQHSGLLDSIIETYRGQTNTTSPYNRKTSKREKMETQEPKKSSHVNGGKSESNSFFGDNYLITALMKSE